jgi:hypothetical protein
MRSALCLRSERGAIFVQVGIAMFVLVAFNVFVLDFGVMWVARQQAQNAADAGALAGAVARSYDNFDPTPSTTGEVAQLATAGAAANMVWNQPATAVVPSFDCPAGVEGRCVRVDVYRDGTHGSTSLPTVFGPLLGVTSQGVKAMAIGLSGVGNATNCLRPMAFADDWVEVHTPTNNAFNAWVDATGAPLPNPDLYTRPAASVDTDFGQRIDFNPSSNALTDPITHSLWVPLDLHGGATTPDYEADIEGCNGQVHQIGEQISLMPSPGALAGTNTTAINDLLAQDIAADYDYGRNRVVNSCAPSCGPVSPRLIPVVLFDPNEYQRQRAQNDWSGCPGGTPCVTVSNIIGIFIHDNPATTPRIHGHMVRYPGMTAAGAPTYDDNASWLTTTSIIR